MFSLGALAYDYGDGTYFPFCTGPLIRNDVVLRDEVSRRGLTRGNLSWASAGLDTGRPGYTLGITPQPHNEGNFMALGRVVRGMDVVEQLQLGDTITAARLIK